MTHPRVGPIVSLAFALTYAHSPSIHRYFTLTDTPREEWKVAVSRYRLAEAAEVSKLHESACDLLC